VLLVHDNRFAHGLKQTDSVVFVAKPRGYDLAFVAFYVVQLAVCAVGFRLVATYAIAGWGQDTGALDTHTESSLRKSAILYVTLLSRSIHFTVICAGLYSLTVQHPMCGSGSPLVAV
jgi:hypothetical protein